MRFEARVVRRKRVRDDQRIVLQDVSLQEESFSDKKLVQFSAAGCRFESCRFDRIRIESGSFGGGREMSEYVGCSFNGARITFGGGDRARFIGCSFRDVDLRDWLCLTTELVDCTFSGRMRRAIFNGTVPERDRAGVGRVRNEFRGNDFSAMDLYDVAFRSGIDLSLQKLPVSKDYLYLPDAPAAIRSARAEVIGWTDLDLRRAAMSLMTSLESELEGGQLQLLLMPSIYAPDRRRAVDAVFEILRNFRTKE